MLRRVWLGLWAQLAFTHVPGMGRERGTLAHTQPGADGSWGSARTGCCCGSSVFFLEEGAERRGRRRREPGPELRGVGSRRSDGDVGPGGRVLRFPAHRQDSRTPVSCPSSRQLRASILPGTPRGSAPKAWGWGPSPCSQPASAAPPGTPAQRRHCGCRADRAPGRFIYLFIFPFSLLLG